MSMSSAKICAHCGLALRGAVLDDGEKSFCCSGCAFVYQLAGGGEAGDSSESTLLVLLALGIVLSGFIMTFSWVLYLYPDLPAALRIQLQYVLLGLTTPVILGIGYPYFKLALQEIPRARLSMSTLIALGTLTAYIYSARVTFEHGQHVYFDTAAMVIVLVTLGKYLQARARARMARAMRVLASDAPATARRVAAESEDETVPVEDVRVGDVLRTLPAERISVDGTILEGRSTFDESILTGESMPVPRGPGERVLQGSMNLDGAILYRAERVGAGTLQAQIESMCARAIGSRMPLQTLVDKVSAWFVGSTLVLAALVLAYYGLLHHNPTDGLLDALAILVVACPCALGIATPMATFVALQRAAREGVLIRAPENLERMAAIDTIVFDKTGTLTEGKLRVVEVIASDLSGVTKLIDSAALLQIAASLEYCSEHHLARAILDRFKLTGGQLFPVADFANHPGEGIEGTIVSAPETGTALRVFLGTEAWLHGIGLRTPANLVLSDDALSLESRVFLAWDGNIRGVIRLQDQLRPNAKTVIENCRQQGLEVHLLSGDREAGTRQVAEALGIENWASEKLPWQKVDYIETLKSKRNRKVAMIGDGLNDAPALASADIGIAHQIGTDLTKEAADVHILSSDLTLVPWSLALSRKTFRHIQQNLFWAFAYNAIAIALAAMGYLRPVMAAAAMLVSSLLVVGNSLRLENFRGFRIRSESHQSPLPQAASSAVGTHSEPSAI